MSKKRESLTAPDLVYAGDLACICNQKGRLYLAVLTDLFNRKVVGWSAFPGLTRQLAIDALRMALD